MVMKYCPKCKNEKILELFCNNKTKKDGKSRICKKCQKEHDLKSYNKHKISRQKRVRKRDLKQKEKFFNYKQTLSCIKCNDTRGYVLDFHHKDPSKKENNVSNLVVSPNKLKKEIDKCVILCSNCHREFHYLQKLNNITLKMYLDF